MKSEMYVRTDGTSNMKEEYIPVESKDVTTKEFVEEAVSNFVVTSGNGAPSGLLKPGEQYLDIDTGYLYIGDGTENKIYVDKDEVESLISAAAQVSVTHAELIALIAANELSPGVSYLISDYVTTYTQPVTSEAMEGTLEPIVVRAISDNELDPIAISTIFPQDVLYYNVDSDATGPGPTPTMPPAEIVPGATKGFIYRRIDTKQNNDLPFDFRQVKFRRWKITSAGTYPNSGYASPQSSTFNDLTVDAEDSDDFYFFSGNYTTCHNNKIEALITDRLTKTNSVVGDNFQTNTIGYSFHSNTVGSSFQTNTIGYSFHSNTVGDNFQINTIGNDFRYNTVGSSFQTNTIGNDFYSNTVGSSFQTNTIGYSFHYNTIGYSFHSNTIGDGFSSKDLSSATYVYGNYSCSIQKNSAGVWKLIYLNDVTLTAVDPLT